MMIVDTNVLLRAWAGDDAIQSEKARAAMAEAAQIFIANTTLCEFVWVARQNYREARADLANSIGLLVSDPRTVVDRSAVEAGLAFLNAGGDFADGVIEFQGRRLGGETFVTFDRKAAAVISSQGRRSLVLDAD
jgi:predicted nucleic-acid-binding protein